MTRKHRLRLFVTAVVLIIAAFLPYLLAKPSAPTPIAEKEIAAQKTEARKALDTLEKLEVKGRAAKTDYRRTQFGDGWAFVGNCDMRNTILARDLIKTEISPTCLVLSGTLNDPYTGSEVLFKRGADTSPLVQIDHVVALSDAWQKGAQQLSYSRRVQLANDPLNLLAVGGEVNQNKSDKDAASWLPPNKPFRCQYISRQISVKAKYRLWVTPAEKQAMSRVIRSCA